MTLHLFDHVFFVLIALVFPILDTISLRKRGALIRAGRTELRMKLYRKVVREQWIVVAALAALWVWLGRDGALLGLVPETGTLVWAGYGLTALICGLLLVQMRATMASGEKRAAFRKQIEALSWLMPHSLAERRAFDGVSLTAGICEELTFRGFAFAYLTAAFGMPLWAAALLSSAAFGFAHMYQGPLGIVKTGLVGLLFAILYMMTGSLWAPIVAHIVMDAVAGRMSYAATSETAPNNTSPELAT